ncbi:MAG: shikimate kinase, partial [Okeania sp. SIO3C4]|nr:shikimate kinase [Okeania sp. SIO3C4]
MNVSNKKLLQGVNLYLVGMMGAGKTTVGELLAKDLGYRFLDMDSLISQVAGKSINEIFADRGEAGFRQLETNVLAEVSSYKNLTIATGGGIVINPFNWSYLQHGIVVWLDVPIEVLH